jgi:hypothetical protein
VITANPNPNPNPNPTRTRLPPLTLTLACRRSVASVITASVPSEPTSRRVRSYPADDLRARPPVVMTSPEG